MTGLDCLREEMERRGFTKSQIESKTAAAVLDILTKSGNKFSSIVEAEAEESELLSKLHNQRYSLERSIAEYRATISSLEYELNGIIKRGEEAQEYIDKFYNALHECETAEGRDAMRRAQVFINTVNVDSKYDNTAYIIALGAILSDGAYGPIDELKKINPKISIGEQESKPKLKIRM